MGKTAKKIVETEARPSIQLTLRMPVRGQLREIATSVGIEALLALLEEDRVALCGPRYARAEERTAYRHGTTRGELTLGGRRISVARPRVRSTSGAELLLPTWEELSSQDALDEHAFERMLVGVSTRKYVRTLEALSSELDSRGVSKSSVSRRFIAKAEAQAAAWLTRRLDKVDLAVLMIDGLHVEGHVIVVALGIDTEGRKHVLGLREGATENAVTCRELLSDLQERGLNTARNVLVVLDGAKALLRAVRDVFGSRAIVQRCQAHKTRNVLEHLPEQARPSVRRALQQAYSTERYETALRLLQALQGSLARNHPGAASSLREGMEETLAIKRYRLSEKLARTLSTTNAIENVVGTARAVARRVRRWINGRMVVRWTAVAMIEAEKNFHRVRDHKQLTRFVQQLRADRGGQSPSTRVARAAA